MAATVAPLQLQQQQLILRLPDDLATRVHILVNEGQTSKGKHATVIDVKPQDLGVPSDDFIFIVDNKEYPALLLNLPTPLESHKTFDNKIFLKSSDIGQMLQVFHTDKEREVARLKVVKTLYGDYHSSGITPPTNDVVKRRFELTRRTETYLPYKIKQVCEEISQGVDSVAGGGLLFNEINAHASKQISGGDAKRSLEASDSNAASAAVLESVVEEIVDFEEWMADPARPGHGVVVTVSGSDWTTKDALFLQQHPEMMLTQVEAEEDALEQMAVEQQRTEKERIASAIAMLSDEGATTQPILMSENKDSLQSTNGSEDNLRISVKATTLLHVDEPLVLAWGNSSNQSPHSNADEDLQMTRDDEDDNKDILDSQRGDDDDGEEEEDEGQEMEEEDYDEEDNTAEEEELNKEINGIVSSETRQTLSNCASDEDTNEVIVTSEDLLLTTVEVIEEPVASGDEDDDEAWMNDI